MERHKEILCPDRECERERIKREGEIEGEREREIERERLEDRETESKRGKA